MIKILHSSQFKEWDHFTMNHEPIASIDLMERASSKAAEKILEIFDFQHFTFFCGTGTNGGDGLAIARILKEKGKNITVYQIPGNHYSHDCNINRNRLKNIYDIIDIYEETEIIVRKDSCIIDALLGSGQNRPVEGFLERLVSLINSQQLQIISIDLPTGMLADESSLGNTIIRSTHTLSFQSYKKAFFLAENAPFLGQIHLINIGLNNDFLKSVQTDLLLVEIQDIQPLLKRRNPFAHKGDFGNALIFGGSKGMLGALILCLKSCLRTGVGKAYGITEPEYFNLIHESIPEALVISRSSLSNLIRNQELEKFQALAIGPGLGTEETVQEFLYSLLKIKKPLILDADALNIIATNHWQDLIPTGSILTPHVGEFDRLFGKAGNDFERLKICQEQAKKLDSYIILKGKYTAIACPDGNIYLNPTGNPGMAKGGSGDVLTGIITSFMAQGMPSRSSCLLGVYMHGLAADFAVTETSEYGLLATDIIDKIGKTFLQITQNNT